MAPSSRWNFAIVGVVELGAPVERRRAVVGQQLARELRVHRLGETLRLRRDSGARSPTTACRRTSRIGQAAGDAMIEAGAGLQAEEAFRRAAVGLDERAVALVDIGGDELGRFGVGAGDDEGRHAADVGGEARRDEAALMLRCRDQNLAAQMAALLFRGELVLEVNAGRAGVDIGLHDLEDVERAAEAGLRVGDDRREPVARSHCLRHARSRRRACSALLMRRASSGPELAG